MFLLSVLSGYILSHDGKMILAGHIVNGIILCIYLFQMKYNLLDFLNMLPSIAAFLGKNAHLANFSLKSYIK